MLVKDEGQRLGLKAFKGVGVGYAIKREIERLGAEKFYKKGSETTITTMTDGNHGRAVAHFAKKMDCKCIIYVPDNMSRERIEAIQSEGAQVVVVEGGYDDAIEEVKRRSAFNGHHLISDTAWPGYETVPADIVAGYGSIFREVEEEILENWSRGEDGEVEPSSSRKPITHVILQCGVGGFASAGAAYAYWHSGRWGNRENAKETEAPRVWSDSVQLICVEPTDSDCVLENVKRELLGKKYVGKSEGEVLQHGNYYLSIYCNNR